MAKKFPKTLYVKIERESSTEYFVADDDASGLVEMAGKIKIATYKLVEVADAEGIAKFGKARRS